MLQFFVVLLLLQTRSRSLTHIAALDALDMSGDAGRPDRLVVPPPAGEACHSLRRQKLTSRSQVHHPFNFSKHNLITHFCF